MSFQGGPWWDVDVEWAEQVSQPERRDEAKSPTDPNCTCIVGNDMEATTGILDCPVHDPEDYSVMPS